MRPETGHMVTKLLYGAAAAVLAITPAAVTALQPPAEADVAFRAVQLDGPFLGFTQTQDRIQVRLKPPASLDDRKSRHRIVIRNADGDEMTIGLKNGQTWASAELPATLAGAAELFVSIN